ncbi:PREDICTED: arabinogalactan protein 1-like [Hipposideros armiger]|uniref:Arabinogalactan protein 1-like n=1 Tax=Hipposideros armiger TaxID=186990 RepID=A0A8B7QC59_HIPAR|nr:PREDICTED: arabinogalactan protein 1-like [Hipposideros armiger]
MELLPAAPPARGTSKGGSAAPRATTPTPFRPRPFSLPGRLQAVRPCLPACRVPEPARYLRGAAPLFVERRARDLLPRRRLRPSCRRLRPASQRPPAAPSLMPPPPAASHVLSQAAEARTVSAAAAATAAVPRSPPGAASPGDTFPASVGRRPAARPSASPAELECRPEA